jgi:hypothetical protein
MRKQYMPLTCMIFWPSKNTRNNIREHWPRSSWRNSVRKNINVNQKMKVPEFLKETYSGLLTKTFRFLAFEKNPEDYTHYDACHSSTVLPIINR